MTLFSLKKKNLFQNPCHTYPQLKAQQVHVSVEWIPNRNRHIFASVCSLVRSVLRFPIRTGFSTLQGHNRVYTEKCSHFLPRNVFLCAHFALYRRNFLSWGERERRWRRTRNVIDTARHRLQKLNSIDGRQTWQKHAPLEGLELLDLLQILRRRRRWWWRCRAEAKESSYLSLIVGGYTTRLLSTSWSVLCRKQMGTGASSVGVAKEPYVEKMLLLPALPFVERWEWQISNRWGVLRWETVSSVLEEKCCGLF